MDNIIQIIEDKRVAKTFANGLSSHTQANCQVTLTDKGLRIYRTPNVLTKANGGSNSMWGGMKLQPYNMENRDVLIKGHTYIIKFHVEGVSSVGTADTECGWTNNMGWGSGGLMPSPSNVSYNLIPANFNGSKECYYQWTINDDIYKTCTTSYSSFVAGTEYLSYKDFAFNWNYQNTGELGTDIYVTNLRMYDLTNGGDPVRFIKSGIVDSIISENDGYAKAAMTKDGEFYTTDIYEI